VTTYYLVINHGQSGSVANGTNVVLSTSAPGGDIIVTLGSQQVIAGMSKSTVANHLAAMANFVRSSTSGAIPFGSQ
jgi:hypothetical protein